MNLFSYRSILLAIAAITLLLPQYDEDLLILKDVMTNVSSSAPNDSFIVNVDIADTLMVGNPSVTLHLLSPDGNSWIDTSLVHLGTLGYENTFGSFLNNGSSSLDWYLTGEIDSEPIFGSDWGRLMFTQLPKAEEVEIPLDDMYYQRLAYTPENDDFEYIDLDILNIQGSYNDSQMYYKLTMQGGGFNLGETWGPWPAYLIGFTNPDGGSAAYAFAYAYWGNGQILSPGVWKIYFDEETGNVSSFESAKDSEGEPIPYDLIIDNENKTLEASFDYSLLIEDEDFGNWPSDSNSLIVIAYTFVCEFCSDPVVCDVNENGVLDLEEMFLLEAFEEVRSTILLDSYKQDSNTAASLSNPAFDDETGNITLDYQDDEGNLPIMRLLSICPDDDPDSDECVEFTMYPSTHSYYEGATFFTNISNTTFSPGDKLVTFSFTDDLDTVSNTTFSIQIPESPGCTDPESCSYDSTANVDDGSCLYFDCFGECGGPAQEDICGACDGTATNPNECACEDGSVRDCSGLCASDGDGYGSIIDDCGICNGDNSTCTGCMDDGTLDTSPYEYAACNYEAIFTIHSPESCQYPHDLYGGQPGDYDCYGNFLSNDSSLLPSSFIVSNPYPNPFNPTVSVDISVDSPLSIDATIFDARGKIVHAFDKTIYSTGSHTLSWSPLDILSGIYFLRLSTDSEAVTHKLVLLK